MIDLRDTPESYGWIRAIVFGGILILSGAVMSLVNYLERHWQKDPFVMSRLIVGISCDAIRALVVGFAIYGSGGSYYLAWAAAMFFIFIGAEKAKEIILDICYKKMGVDKKNEKNNK